MEPVEKTKFCTSTVGMTPAEQHAHQLITRYSYPVAIDFADQMIKSIWEISSEWIHREAVWGYWKSVKDAIKTMLIKSSHDVIKHVILKTFFESVDTTSELPTKINRYYTDEGLLEFFPDSGTWYRFMNKEGAQVLPKIWFKPVLLADDIPQLSDIDRDELFRMWDSHEDADVAWTAIMNKAQDIINGKHLLRDKKKNKEIISLRKVLQTFVDDFEREFPMVSKYNSEKKLEQAKRILSSKSFAS